MRRAVKRRSRNCRRALTRSSSHSRPTAATASSSLVTVKPVRPSSITSGTEPQLNAITGVPQIMDSIITRPNGSGQSIANSVKYAPRQEYRFLGVVDLADELNMTLRQQRLDLGLEVFLVGVVDLGGYFELHAGARSGADRLVDALLGRDAARKAR